MTSTARRSPCCCRSAVGRRLGFRHAAGPSHHYRIRVRVRVLIGSFDFWGGAGGVERGRGIDLESERFRLNRGNWKRRRESRAGRPRGSLCLLHNIRQHTQRMSLGWVILHLRSPHNPCFIGAASNKNCTGIFLLRRSLH